MPKYQNSHRPFATAARVMTVAMARLAEDRQSNERCSESRPLGVTLNPKLLGMSRSNIDRNSGKLTVPSYKDDHMSLGHPGSKVAEIIGRTIMKGSR